MGRPGLRRAAGTIAERGRHPVREAEQRLDRATGGPARRKVVVLLGLMLALDSADKGAMSAVANGIKGAFGVTNAGIGVLVSVVSLVGAVLTLPMGVLVDRMRRTRLLWIAILLWTLAMIASGAAPSFLFLLVARVFLGAITALAAPAVASLLGDYFPARDRGRIYGMVLAGELIGLGAGLLIAGVLSQALDWRWAFWGLAPFSLLIAWAIRRWLPEPARGGQSWLRVGARHLRSERDVAEGRYEGERAPEGDGAVQGELARRAVEDDDVQPREALVLHEDPRNRSLWWAMKYVLSVPTTRVLIVASALAYFYFSGLRAFAIVFVTGHFGISRSTAVTLALVVGICAVGGVVAGGRISDRLLARGRFDARIVVVPVALVLAVVLFVAPVLVPSLAVGLPLICLAAASLSAANPPLDAARLDIMPPQLWGRAESIRQFLRGLFEAAAPTAFGFLSTWVFGGGTTGLQWTLLLMLGTLLLGAAVSVLALRTYRRDVATAAASVAAMGEHREALGEPAGG